MVAMWIANGLVKPSLVDAGNACFHRRSFFTDITRDKYNNNVLEFRIPILIHEILEDVARIIYKENQLGFIASMSEDVAQISLVSSLPHNLQTLISSPTLYSGGSLDHYSFVDFRALCSLDLSCSGIHNLSGDICMLRELRYLNLSYTLIETLNLSYTLIETLPDSIMDLSLLQTLDLSWCYHLKLLPKGLRNLTLMSHLDLSRCESLSCFPSGVCSLTFLSSMPLFVLGKDEDSARLRELGPLNWLQGRLEIRNLENVREIVEAKDAKLDQKRLEHLELSWSQNDDDCFRVMELLEPNQQLKVVDIRGYRGSEFPQWISSINSLVKISITDCGCRKLPSLGQLPFLKELQLKGMVNLEYIGPEFYGTGTIGAVFLSLERLEVYNLPNLLEWFWGDDSRVLFLSLKFVTVEGCPKLRSLPSFSNLHDLIVSNSNRDILPFVANYKTLCSLLINGIGLEALRYLHTFGALKKLILRNIHDESIYPFLLTQGKMLTSLQHLGILHCNKLPLLDFSIFSSLKKLHIVDCHDLRTILMQEKDAMLMELVVEDCPQAFAYIFFHKMHCLRKLIVRNCTNRFTIYDEGEYKRLEKLQYLLFSGCPRIEMELQAHPGLVSHIPCVIVGNHKANYQETYDSRKRIQSPDYYSHQYSTYVTSEEEAIHRSLGVWPPVPE